MNHMVQPKSDQRFKQIQSESNEVGLVPDFHIGKGVLEDFFDSHHSPPHDKEPAISHTELDELQHRTDMSYVHHENQIQYLQDLSMVTTESEIHRYNAISQNVTETGMI